MKRLIALTLVAAGTLLAAAGGRAGETALKRALPLEKPQPGMSAGDLMKINYIIKYTKFADDLKIGDAGVYYLSPGGNRRFRGATRLRITLNRPQDGLDYKDLVALTSPENVKGLSILTWSYLDPKKQRDQWLWLPSLKKVRRVSPAGAEDSFMGSDFTTEDITSRRWEDETYRKLPDEVFAGYQLKYNGETINKDVSCSVVECKPRKKDWYYSKRKVYLDKSFGGNIFEEIYDPRGRKVRTIARAYKIFPEGPGQVYLEVTDLRTGHATTIVNKDWEFNRGLSEKLFTSKNLMRTKW